jgi:Leucine Rich repeat
VKYNGTLAALDLGSNCIGNEGALALGDALKDNATLAVLHLVMNGIGDEGAQALADALKGSPNLWAVSGVGGLEIVAAKNKKAAQALLEKIQGAAPKTREDIETLRLRLPAVIALAEERAELGGTRVDDILAAIEESAIAAGVEFTIPDRFQRLVPFKPTADKVSFESVAVYEDLYQAGGADEPLLYRAVESGQIDELMGYLRQNGKTLTADDCLLKPAGKACSLVQLIARQGKLAAIMTVENWIGNPRGLARVGATVSPLALKRQLKDRPFPFLISAVNAASAKSARRPKRGGESAVVPEPKGDG